MPQHIDVPGMGVVEFPDGMSDDAIAAAIKANAPPSVAMDMAKSAAIGVPEGLIQGAGAAGDVRGLVSKGADYLGGKVGLSPESIQTAKDVTSRALKMTPMRGLAEGPTSEEIQKKVEGVTGEFYEPKTREGRYTNATIKTLANPTTYLGPGGLPMKLATGVTSAVGGELGGELGDTKGRIAGALLGSVVPGVARRGVTMFPATSRHTELVGNLEDKGVTSLTAGDRTGSPVLRALESKIGNTPGTGFAADRIAGEGEKQFTQATMRDLGETGMATKAELQAAKDRIGGTFEEMSGRNLMLADMKMVDDLAKAETLYARVLDANQKPIFDKLLTDIVDKAAGGGMTGAEYQIARSQLGSKARGLQVTDPEGAKAFKGLQKALDDAMERGLSDADKTAWRAARDQYGRLKDVEGAVAKEGPGLVEGVIDPVALNRSISSGKDASAAARGQLPYSKLAEAGAGVMTRPGRAAISSPTLGGYAVGIPNAIAGRLLMSPVGQSIAGNQIFSQAPKGASKAAIVRALLTQGLH